MFSSTRLVRSTCYVSSSSYRTSTLDFHDIIGLARNETGLENRNVEGKVVVQFLTTFHSTCQGKEVCACCLSVCLSSTLLPSARLPLLPLTFLVMQTIKHSFSSLKNCGLVLKTLQKLCSLGKLGSLLKRWLNPVFFPPTVNSIVIGTKASKGDALLV